MTWGRRIGYLVVTLIVAGGLVYGYMPKPVLVEVALVQRGPLRVTVEEEGKTRVIDRFVLSAPVPGFARRVELNVGDPVTAGQVVVRLDALRSSVLDPRSRAEAVARLAAAKAAFQAAEESARAVDADADLAEAELARVTRLHEGGNASREALDQVDAAARRARAACRSAEFNIDIARHNVEAAKTALNYSAAEDVQPGTETVTVRAPVAGRVLRIVRESEGVVRAGEPLIEIGDPEALEVEVDVLSADAVRIAPGTQVFYERWGGGPALEGRVRVVEPVGFTKVSALGVEEQRVLVIADIASPPERWQRLGDGYRLEASFVLWKGENVLHVPASALFRWHDGWAVFMLEDGRARRRLVEIGHRSGVGAEIVSGLQEGDMVIQHPDDRIEDNVRVQHRLESEALG